MISELVHDNQVITVLLVVRSMNHWIYTISLKQRNTRRRKKKLKRKEKRRKTMIYAYQIGHFVQTIQNTFASIYGECCMELRSHFI